MAAPGVETEKRRAIARQVVDHLAAHTDLRASMLAGSAAVGTCDEHSDIDLLNYYDELPDPATFTELMRTLGAEPMGEIGEPTAEGFGGSFRVVGVVVQTGGETIAATEKRLERIAAADVDWITVVRDWQIRAAYPEELRRRAVEANLGLFPIWVLDEHLAARDAELFRRQMLLDGAFRVLAILSAINRLYFCDFQFKRARAHVAHMAVKPQHLAESLDLIAGSPPSDAAAELGKLVHETKAIVRAEMPDVDVERPWSPNA